VIGTLVLKRIPPPLRLAYLPGISPDDAFAYVSVFFRNFPRNRYADVVELRQAGNVCSVS
jgi:hypothetical protein